MRVPNSFLIGSLLLTLSAPAALAQQTETSPASSPQAETNSGFGGERKDRTEINFPGGTLEKYVEMLRKLFPNDSIVLAPGVQSFEIPAITARVRSLMDALRLTTGIDGELVYPATSTEKGRVYGGELITELIGTGVYRVIGVKKSVRGGMSRPTNTLTTEVYPVLKLQDSGLSIEEILGTLQVAFELQDEDPPVLRYHKATSILFIKGTEVQHQIFDHTYDALESIASERSVSVKAKYEAAASEGDAMTKEIDSLKSQIKDIIAERAAYEAEIEAQKYRINVLNLEIQEYRKQLRSPQDAGTEDQE